MMFDVIEALYIAIPIGAVLFFAISLIRYLYAKHKNKKAPDTYSQSQMKSRRICLFVSSVIAGILAVVVIGFMALLFMAVAFM